MAKKVEDFKLPFDREALENKSREPGADYMLKLVKTLQELLEDIQGAANVAIDINTDLSTVISGTENQITVTDEGDDSVTISIPIGAIITFANIGLHILDTDASHDLIIKPGSNLTADRTLIITTGDFNRRITLSGSPTLGDWFDQNVKVAASPTHVALTLSGLTASRFVSTDADKKLVSTALENWIKGTVNQIIVTVNDDGTITLSTPQDIHTEAVPTFNGLIHTAVTLLDPVNGELATQSSDNRLYFGTVA